jgi:hypothetical protein
MTATDFPNGIEFNAPRHLPARAATLCVHFTGRGIEHGICFAEAAPGPEVARAQAARLEVEWEQRPGAMFLGRALLRGEVACDAYLLSGESTAGDREQLRAEGLPREWAVLLYRMPERPLLCTVARGPDLSPQLLRRIHSLLLATAGAPIE